VHGPARAREMDARLHGERLGPRPLARASELPDGAFLGGPDACFRVEAGRARRWSWQGYGELDDLPASLPLLTPLAIVALLARGYRPGIDGAQPAAPRPAQTSPAFFAAKD